MIDPMILNHVKEVSLGFERIYSGKKVLITGGAGFIGSWLADIILELAGNVTCIDNLSTGNVTNIDHHVNNSSFAFVQGDLTKIAINGKYDYMLHLASRASPRDYQQHPIETMLVNSQGSYQVLELARKADSRVLYTSSSEVYGDADVIPTPEGYWGHVNPIGLRSCYDEGKRFGEALFMAYARQYGLDIRIARLFNCYGPRMRATGSYALVIPRFVQQALRNEPITVYGDGTQTRSFCYVMDTCRGILTLMASEDAQREVVNIGATMETTILDLAQRIKKFTQTKSPIVFGELPADDPKRRCPDMTKARTILNWTPNVSLDDGLKKTIRWCSDTSNW